MTITLSSFRPLFLYYILSALSVYGYAQKQDPLTVRVESFFAKKVTPLEAIILLAAQTDIPVGVVCEDTALLESTVDISESQGTVASTLQKILRTNPLYIARSESNGVLRIYSTKIDPLNALETFRFESFQTVDAEPATLISARLWGKFQQGIDPKRKGYGGVLRVPNGDHEIPPLDLKNASIASILDVIVGTHKSMAWIAWPAPSSIVGAPQIRLWNFVYYPTADANNIKICCVVIPADLISVPITLRKQLAERFIGP